MWQSEVELRSIKSADLNTFFKTDLKCGQPFNDLHRPVATWTLPHCGLSISNHWRCRRLAGETISTNGQQCGALPIGEPTEVANARKSLGQYVL